MRADRTREAIDDLGPLTDDDAVAERPELPEHGDLGPDPERGSAIEDRQGHVEVHLHEAVDARIAPAGPRAQTRGRLDLEDLDLEWELHPERPDPLADDGGVPLAVLDGPDLLRSRDQGRESWHVPEQVPHRLAGRANADLTLDPHRASSFFDGATRA